MLPLNHQDIFLDGGFPKKVCEFTRQVTMMIMRGRNVSVDPSGQRLFKGPGTSTMFVISFFERKSLEMEVS